MAGAAACAIWRAGLIDSLQAAFVVSVARGDEPLQAPQTWLALLLIVTISTSAGFFVGRVGARRSFLFLGIGFLATCTASLLVSRYLKIDILFAPMAVGSTAAVFLVQLHRLWLIDTLLTRRVNETISRTDAQDVSIAENRLTSGLKLLQTILPLEEAFVFQPNEDGALVPCARLRAQASGSLQAGRNSVWRKLVQLCDKAAKKHEIALAPIGEIDTLEMLRCRFSMAVAQSARCCCAYAKVLIKVIAAYSPPSVDNLHAIFSAKMRSAKSSTAICRRLFRHALPATAYMPSI